MLHFLILWPDKSLNYVSAPNLDDLWLMADDLGTPEDAEYLCLNLPEQAMLLDLDSKGRGRRVQNATPFGVKPLKWRKGRGMFFNAEARLAFSKKGGAK